MAERVVRRDEEPRIATGLHDRASGSVGEHPRVVGPVDRVGRARLARQVGRRRTGHQKRLALFLGDLVDRERDSGIGRVDDHIHLVDVVPLPRDCAADVRLVLVVGGDDLDLVTALLDPGVLDRHSCRDDGARSGEIGVQARHVGEHADLDRVVRDLCLRGAAGERCGHRDRRHVALECLHLPLLQVCGHRCRRLGFKSGRP